MAGGEGREEGLPSGATGGRGPAEEHRRADHGPWAELPLDPEGAPPAPHRGAASRLLVPTVALSGAVGALARYGVSRLAPAAPGQFPWATFAVNVAGAALVGFVLVLLLERFPRSRLARPLVVTGFLGGFTTFSTLIVDAVLLVRDHRVPLAAAYLLGTTLAGLAAVGLGMAAGRLAVRIDERLEEVQGSGSAGEAPSPSPLGPGARREAAAGEGLR